MNGTLRIAFLIAAHNDRDHLERLVNRLAPHAVFIHWDLKSGPAPAINGATFVNRPKAVYWAGFSQVQATVSLIETALNTGEHYLKLVLISGSCYPIKNMNDLVNHFSGDNDFNYINSVEVDQSPHLSSLVRRITWRDGILPWRSTTVKPLLYTEKALRKLFETATRPFRKSRPAGLKLYHGSSWWALSSDCCKYIVQQYHCRGDLRRFYRFTFASDEQFFHTVVLNSYLADKSSRPMPYVSRGTYLTANLHIIDPSLSKWFKLCDIGSIKGSDKFFVRKVNSIASEEFLRQVDQELFCQHQQ